MTRLVPGVIGFVFDFVCVLRMKVAYWILPLPGSRGHGSVVGGLPGFMECRSTWE